MRLGSLLLMVAFMAPASACLGGAPGSAKDAAAVGGGLVPSLLNVPPQLVGAGADAESGLDVSDDGQTILLCTHGGFTQVSPLWASTDAGRSFRRIEPQPDQPFDGDCDVSIGADGSWYIVYDTVASATVASSRDQGITWTVTYVDGLPLGGVDRPWIEALGRTVYLAYQNVAAAEPSLNVFAVSTDGGVTWTPHVYSHADPPDRFMAIGGHPFVADAGRTVRILLAHTSVDGKSHALELAVSRDAGDTWTKQPIRSGIPEVDGMPTATRGGDGTLWAAYTIAGAGNIGDVVVFVSHDDGASWDGPKVVAHGETFAAFPTAWIDGRPDGSADLVWMGASKDGNGTVAWQPRVARVHDHAGFAVDFAGRAGAPGKPNQLYEFSMVRHDAAGRAYIDYPLLVGPECKETPAFPSAVGSGAVPRNNLCLFFLKEP